MDTTFESLMGNEPPDSEKHFEYLLYGDICNISICENRKFFEHFFSRKYAFCGEIVMFASTNVKIGVDVLVLRGHRYMVSYPKISFFIDSQARICEILISDPIFRHSESTDFFTFSLYDLLWRPQEGLRNFSGRRNFYGNRFFEKFWNMVVKFILPLGQIPAMSGTNYVSTHIAAF